MRHHILVIHGPNLNLLGVRETGIYGVETLDSINEQIKEKVSQLGNDCEIFQSNTEGAIIDKIHSAFKNYDGIIINPGAFTHYSIAIRDAITAVRVPCIEVHLTNIYARDEFRHVSVISPVCAGQIAGFGKLGYFLAVTAISDLM